MYLRALYPRLLLNREQNNKIQAIHWNCIGHIDNEDLNTNASTVNRALFINIKNLQKQFDIQLQDFNYSKALKKPSEKLLEFGLSKGIISENEYDFIQNLPKIHPQKNAK